MGNLSRVFQCDKHIMLNIIYDTLDDLGFKVKKANKERGTIIVTPSKATSEYFHIACNNLFEEKGVLVQIFPEVVSDRKTHLAEVLMDEISATAKRCLIIKKGDKSYES